MSSVLPVLHREKSSDVVPGEHHESIQVASLHPGRNGSVASPLESGASTWLSEGCLCEKLCLWEGGGEELSRLDRFQGLPDLGRSCLANRRIPAASESAPELLILAFLTGPGLQVRRTRKGCTCELVHLGHLLVQQPQRTYVSS